MTCLCITRNRREWLPKAIQCFQKQTYPARELLIVSDGADVRDLVPQDDRIRHIHIEGSANIGEKRNFGCDRARGEIIAVWDDDDWSAPTRLSDQVDRLVSSGKGVTGYRTILFTNGRQWWRYEGKPNYSLGTALCFRAFWWRGHNFRCLQIGEDNAFVEQAARLGELVATDAGELMVATVHDNNTSPKVTDRPGWVEIFNFIGVPGYTWSGPR